MYELFRVTYDLKPKTGTFYIKQCHCDKRQHKSFGEIDLNKGCRRGKTMVKEGVSTSFSLRKTLSALYSGGGAEWSGGIIFTAAEGKVNLVSISHMMVSLVKC